MKIIRRSTIDWATLEIESEDAYEYEGPVALGKDAGSAPQPVDPWTQAAAQYGLSTGTAQYNAGLNRTNQTNPLGSSYWTTNQGMAPGPTGTPPDNGLRGGSGLPNQLPTPGTSGGYSLGGSPSGSVYPPGGYYGNTFNIPSGSLSPGIAGGYSGNPSIPNTSAPGFNLGGAPPTYTLNTQLAPQFQSLLQQPIDTAGLAGMPGGPSTTQDLQSTQDALYKSQEQYLQPEQKLQTEQLQSQLANEGATPGSAAYNNEMDRLSRQQEFANSNARTSAITGAGQEQSRLFGLGSQALQNQIAVRNAPISEYNALTGAPGAGATALTPDISGAFGQQYQGALAGYNANVASDNATTSSIGSLALAAALYF